MIDDKLKDPIMTVDDPSLGYFWDSYELWEVKEQIKIGNEVEKPKNETITIDTSETSIEKVEQTYTLTVPNPDWKIFSLGIDWMERTFKIGFFNNTALAYSTLETELQTWLWENYTVVYVSWTTFNISKYDGSAIVKTSPNLVRNVTITGFSIYTRITIIVDWVSVLLDWATHSWNVSTALDYLKTQLSASIYYMGADWINFIIARKDWVLPVISQTQSNIYQIWYYYYDTPSSWMYWDYTNTTIAGNSFYTAWSKWRPFYWDRILRNIAGFTVTNVNTWSMIDTTSENTFRWVRILVNTTWTLKSITIVSWVTATRAILQDDSGTQLATATISWWVATFNYPVTQGTYYRIWVDSSGAYYTTKYQGNWTWTTINAEYCNYVSWIWLFSIYSIDIEAKMDLTGYTILWKEFNKSTGWNDSTWTIWNESAYYDRYHYLYLIKNDYWTISINSVNTYTNPWSFPNDSYWFTLLNIWTATTSTVTTYTEITITNALSSNGYYIPVWFNSSKIEITAESTAWRSTWTWEWWAKRWVQSCNSSVSWFVSDKVFQTSGTNYGNVTKITRAWFYMNWTTDTANKLLIKCSQ